MKNKTSYFVVNCGVFVCEECAGLHNHFFPMGKHYLKEMFTEHWDPTQLKFVAAASNQEFYELTKEFGIEKYPI